MSLAFWTGSRESNRNRRLSKRSALRLDFEVLGFRAYQEPPQGPLIESLWPFIVGIWGILEGSWGA